MADNTKIIHGANDLYIFTLYSLKQLHISRSEENGFIIWSGGRITLLNVIDVDSFVNFVALSESE